MSNKISVVPYQNGSYNFKLYDVLAQKHISHNKFMRDTDTGYGTMRRYANGTVQKVDLALMDRWCSYLNCSIGDIIDYKKRK